MLIDRMACACPGDRLFLLASNWWRRWTTTTPSPTAAPWTGLRLLCQEKCWSRFVTGPRVFVISIFLTWLNSSGCDAQTLVGTIFGYAYDFMTPFPRCVPTVTVAKAGKVQDHSAWADLLIRNIGIMVVFLLVSVSNALHWQFFGSTWAGLSFNSEGQAVSRFKSHNSSFQMSIRSEVRLQNFLQRWGTRCRYHRYRLLKCLLTMKPLSLMGFIKLFQVSLNVRFWIQALSWRKRQDALNLSQTCVSDPTYFWHCSQLARTTVMMSQDLLLKVPPRMLQNRTYVKFHCL